MNSSRVPPGTASATRKPRTLDESEIQSSSERQWRFAAVCCGLLALGVLSAAAAADDDATINLLWRTGVALATVSAVIIASRSPRIHAIVVVGIAVLGLRITTIDFGPAAGTLAGSNWLSASVDLVFGLGMLGAILWLTRRYRGRLDRHAALDGFIVGSGAGLITWVILIVPALDHEMHPALAIASTLHLPIAVLLFTFTVDLLLDGLMANRAVTLLAAATSCTLFASGLKALMQVEQIGKEARLITLALFVLSLVLVSLALSHPDLEFVHHVNHPSGSTAEGDALRLAPLVASMLVPVCLIALVSPSSNLDRAARMAGAFAVAVALVVRLLIASRAIARSERTLADRINHDELTGLPTRNRFIVDVTESLERTWRSEHLPTVIHLSLDRFKNINDSMGHDLANEALAAVSERLATIVASFGGVASRTAGDEFAVLDASITSVEAALHLADELAEIIRLPIVIGESMVFVTSSIGVAVAPRSRTISAVELMRRADIAVHQAKARGRDRVALFDDSMQADIANRMDVEHALHGAIGRGEMRLYQQPIVDISTGRLSGFEALIRWERSPDVMLPPGEFIAIAEETGLINEIGSWALREALCDLRKWIDEGIAPATTTMSVNVSPRQLADPGFPSVVRSALDISGVSPHLLWIEMTESMMINEPELAKRTLSEVRAMGVRIALDDFGTGYSSLSLLQQFPIQRIKIDRAFISGIAERSHDRSLVRTIIAMAQSMGLDLVAEGIETVHQLQSLRELGCDKAQGFLISRPVPAAAVRGTIAAIAELAELSMFQSGGDATQPMARPNEPAYPAMSELSSHGGRPLGRPFV
jgi:diguanylate cyclase (GGDEF)-like protein